MKSSVLAASALLTVLQFSCSGDKQKISAAASDQLRKENTVSHWQMTTNQIFANSPEKAGLTPKQADSLAHNLNGASLEITNASPDGSSVTGHFLKGDNIVAEISRNKTMMTTGTDSTEATQLTEWKNISFTGPDGKPAVNFIESFNSTRLSSQTEFQGISKCHVQRIDN